MDLGRIAALTALSPSVLKKIDEGRFEDLPGGVYARSYVRAFAEAVGIPPETAVKEVEDLLPGAPDPLPALRDSSGPSLVTRLAGWLAGFITARWAEFRVPATPSLRRLFAMLLDASFLFIIASAQTVATAWICGVAVDVLLVEAGWALAATFLVPVGLYFMLFERVGGRSPGSLLCDSPPKPRRVDLRFDRFADWLLRRS